MKMNQLSIALIALGLVTGAAQAQTVDQRHADQTGRIGQGVGTGQSYPWGNQTCRAPAGLDRRPGNAHASARWRPPDWL